MEMIMSYPIRQTTFKHQNVFEKKHKFRVDLEQAKTISLAVAIHVTTHQTKALTNVSVPVSSGGLNKVNPGIVWKNIWHILYAVGFLTWFLSSY